jgi:hypothetical protein
LVISFPGSCLAADHTNLEEGLPTQIEDAYATAYMNREIQLAGRFERTNDGKDRFRLEPIFEYGVAHNAEVSLSVPFLLGNADKTGSGNVRIDALYNLNTESVLLPAFAVVGEAELPSGRDAAGVDTTVKLIASKMINPYSTWLHRLHLNAMWTHNAGSTAEERSDMFAAIIGFSARIGKDTVGIIDIIRRQEREKNKESNIAEIGIRCQWNPLTVISAGGGYGFGDESPKLRLMLGLQRSF